jgi:hypothetical protein
MVRAAIANPPADRLLPDDAVALRRASSLIALLDAADADAREDEGGAAHALGDRSASVTRAPADIAPRRRR